MSASNYFDRWRLLAPGEVKTVGFNDTDNLSSGETLSSISTSFALLTASADISFSGEAINVATFVTDDGETVGIGKGAEVTVTVSSSASDADHIIKGICDTTDSDSHALYGGVRVRAS